MPDICRHDGYVSSFHDDLCAGLSCLFILNLPVDLVTELDKPFHAIISVFDWQDIFLGRWAKQTLLDDRAD